MKINAIVRIVAFSVAILLLSFILFSSIDQNYYFEDGRLNSYEMAGPEPTESPRQVNQHEITTQIRNIEIDWVAGSIVIHRSDSLSSIIVEEFCSDPSAHEMVVKQSGQTLKIEFSDDSVKFPGFGIDIDYSKDLVIRVPSNWTCNNLEIDTASTEVNIHDLSINELDFDGASGNLILDNCNIISLDVDTASGNVEFTGIMKDLDFDAASAKFYGEFYQIPQQLNLDAMSGNVELVLPSHCGFYLELDTMSGSFDSDFDFHSKDSHYQCGDGACKIKVSSASGDVRILKGDSNTIIDSEYSQHHPEDNNHH